MRLVAKSRRNLNEPKKGNKTHRKKWAENPIWFRQEKGIGGRVQC